MLIGVMSDAKSQKSSVLPFAPRPETIADTVRRLAKDTKNIKWSVHALVRMDERGITDRVALEALRFGVASGPVEGGANPGEWKVKMVRQVKGKREVGVVVLTVRNAKLFVKTVEWEDLP